MVTFTRVRMSTLIYHKPTESYVRAGPAIMSAYTLAFQTHLFSVLPTSFTRGFRDLIHLTFGLTHKASAPDWLFTLIDTQDQALPRVDIPLWAAFEELGLLDRYESLVSSVCHEYVEAHILEACAKKWNEPMLTKTREWMTDQIVPWMVMPYARGARNGKAALFTEIPSSGFMQFW